MTTESVQYSPQGRAATLRSPGVGPAVLVVMLQDSRQAGSYMACNRPISCPKIAINNVLMLTGEALL